MRSKAQTIHSSRSDLTNTFTSISPNSSLESLGIAAPIGSPHANFLLVPILASDGSGKPDSSRAQRVYKRMAEEMGVVVRFRGNETGCEGCLRVTIGTKEENVIMLKKLEEALKIEN
jgi:histidinol-phosphate aminotransferase